MARVSYTIQGADIVKQRLEGLENPGRVLDPAVRTWTKGTVLRRLYGVQNYAPPIPPGLWARMTTPKQKAAFFAKLRRGEWTKRTGTLGNAWRVERVNDGVYKVTNPTPYANWIVGNAIAKQQTRWARVYWWRFRERLDEDYPELLRRCQDATITYWQRGRYGL